LKLISGYRDSKIGCVSFVILGMIAVLCFRLLFYFLCEFAKVLFAYHIIVWNSGLNLGGFCVDFVRLDLT